MQWRAREDYSRLRRSPFGLVQLALHDSAAARLSNDLFICREFECVVRNKKGSPCLESLSAMAGPGRFELRFVAIFNGMLSIAVTFPLSRPRGVNCL